MINKSSFMRESSQTQGDWLMLSAGISLGGHMSMYVILNGSLTGRTFWDEIRERSFTVCCSHRRHITYNLR